MLAALLLRGPPSLTLERTRLYMQNMTLEEIIPVEVIGPITCQTFYAPKVFGSIKKGLYKR